MTQVEFYLLPGTDERARFKLACRLTERAYLAGQRVFVAFTDPAQMQTFDEMLWTFADRSFVPHDAYREESQWQETPVLLGCVTQPQQSFDLLVNLSEEIPPAYPLARCVTEIIDGDEPRRRAGRQRYRRYREQGLTPKTHNIPAEQSP